MIDASRIPSAVAIVPARGGSKGLPRKNLRLLANRPLLAWSIDAAQAACHLAAFYVSTEDDEIAEVAQQCGAPVIRRPADLSTDAAQNDAVVRHALLEIDAAARFELVVLLQPTSPLRRSEHIDACVEGLVRSGARSAMTVAMADVHPGKSVVLKDGLVEPFTTWEDMEKRRQEMVEVYRQNGAVYALGVGDFLAHGCFYLPPCYGVRMSRRDSIDIDHELDLMLAELILSRRTHAMEVGEPE